MYIFMCIEFPTEACVGSYHFALTHATGVKFPDFRRTKNWLPAGVRGENVQPSYIQCVRAIFILSSLLLSREVCYHKCVIIIAWCV